jgi:hypothetical protein
MFNNTANVMAIWSRDIHNITLIGASLWHISYYIGGKRAP